MKTNPMKLLMIAGFSLWALGCDSKIEIKDGIVPLELLAAVQPFIGNYAGQIERKPETLSVSLNSNRLVLAPNPDLIAPVCGSKIGNLLSIVYKTKENSPAQLKHAEFVFDPNLCQDSVAGQKLEIDFPDEPNSLPRFAVSFLDHLEYSYYCSGDPAFPGRWYHPGFPYYDCGPVRYAVYLTGYFAKNP